MNQVELTLPKEANIYASEYQLYLPDKEALKQRNYSGYGLSLLKIQTRRHSHTMGGPVCPPILRMTMTRGQCARKRADTQVRPYMKY